MPSDTPFSELAQVNPPRPALDLCDLDPVSFIPMGNVSESGRWTEQQSRPYGEVRRGYTYCAEGDVLFAKITPCTENGKGCHAIGLTNGVGFASTEFHVLRAKEGVDPLYLSVLSYIFQWSVNLPLRLNAAAHMTGSAGQQRVPADFFSRFAVPKLPLPEQSKIADVLSTVDRAIEQTEALIAKHQRVKTGLMQDLLTRGIDEHGNLRSEQTHKFKDSPLGRIPVEWESASLAVFVPSAEYGISTSLGESGYPVLRMNNVFDGEAELSDLKFTDAPVPEHLWLRDGDVLFNRTNSWEHVGRTGIWRGQIESATFASYLVRLNPHPDKLLPEILNSWLNWERIQIAMRRQATPAVQQVNINPTNLRSIPAAFPRNLDEQTAITVRISAVKEVFSAYREHLHKLKSMKAGLMQDLLTGDRRVTALLEQREEVTT